VLRVTVTRDEDVFHAACPALPGCFSWGHTEREALDNLREVARLWIETKQEVGEPIPVREIDLQDGVTIANPIVRTITIAA
jgi:antitoxin HicB